MDKEEKINFIKNFNYNKFDELIEEYDLKNNFSNVKAFSFYKDILKYLNKKYSMKNENIVFRIYTSGCCYLNLEKGYYKNIIKITFNKFYPNIFIMHFYIIISILV